MTTVKIAPSLLAADFARLEADVAAIEPFVDWLHLDVMDGHFVPNISFGMPIISSLRKVSDLYFDCHLMISNPETYLDALAEAGADLVTMHIEVVSDPASAAAKARKAGLDFGLACSPSTPFEEIAPYVEICDLILVMSVEPGFGGQSFMDDMLDKVRKAREWVEERGLRADIQIDGGITAATAAKAAAAGANVFVAGTTVFAADDPSAAVGELRRVTEKI